VIKQPSYLYAIEGRFVKATFDLLTIEIRKQ